MMFKFFVFLDDFWLHAQNTLKSSLFEVEVASFKSAQLLASVFVLETRGHEIFKYDIRFSLNIKNPKKKVIFGNFLSPARKSICYWKLKHKKTLH